jgi:hypothetical protein
MITKYQTEIDICGQSVPAIYTIDCGDLIKLEIETDGIGLVDASWMLYVPGVAQSILDDYDNKKTAR